MRKIWQKVKGEWRVVKYGCMTCEATYKSLIPYEKHVEKCRINTIKRQEREQLKEQQYASTYSNKRR